MWSERAEKLLSAAQPCLGRGGSSAGNPELSERKVLPGATGFPRYSRVTPSRTCSLLLPGAKPTSAQAGNVSTGGKNKPKQKKTPTLHALKPILCCCR